METAFTFPILDLGFVGVPLLVLDLDFLAKAAIFGLWGDMGDQFHAARFTTAVLLVAVGLEVTPAEILALIFELLVEAHFGEKAGNLRTCISLVVCVRPQGNLTWFRR